jgi:hypothetical protein
MKKQSLALLLVCGLLVCGGCAAGPNLACPVGRSPGAISYDANGDGRVDYRQRLDPAGRVVALEFDCDADGTFERTVGWPARAPAAPHFIIVLDGAPFVAAENMQREGHFKLFPPLTRTVAPFPVMTDLALDVIFHTSPSPGFESRYFDRSANRVAGGTISGYLEANNSPWVSRLDYRVSYAADALAYLDPQGLFRRELDGTRRLFESARGPGTVVSYLVSTAGLGTGGGEPAIREYLARVDQLAEEIVYERRGFVSVTILADHGQDLVPGKRVVFDDYLKSKGWMPAKSIASDKDVVIIDYGLVTMAAMFTRSGPALAGDLACHPAVDLAMYPQPDGSVVVLKGGESGPVQKATVRKAGSGSGEAYYYESVAGDPLDMLPVIEQLRGQGKVASDGAIAEDVLFVAPPDHDYPDALRRVVRAFSTQEVSNPADVLVSLKEQYHHGSPLFEFFEKRQSTHGSLRRINSETFVLTTRRPLPPLVKQEEILPRLGVLWAKESGQ